MAKVKSRGGVGRWDLVLLLVRGGLEFLAFYLNPEPGALLQGKQL